MKNTDKFMKKILPGIYSRLTVLAEHEANDILCDSYIALARTMQNRIKEDAHPAYARNTCGGTAAFYTRPC